MNKIIGWVVVVIIVIAGIHWYVNKRPSSDSNQPIKIGVIAGTTGQYAPAGEAYIQGFNLALQEWNESGKTPRFEAVIEDDGFEAVKGLSAYKKLREVDQVDAYAILSSFTIDAVYDEVQAENKPVALGFEQSRPAEDDNIFQVLPAAKPVQFALGQKVKELDYKKPIAAVSNNTPVYQNFYDGFQAGFVDEVVKFAVGSDIGGLRSQALAMMASKPDAVAFFMAPRDGALLVKELLKIASVDRPDFFFDQSIQSGARDYEEILGMEIAKIDGSLVSMSKNDFTEDFKNNFTAQYNVAPPFASDMGYNSFKLLASTYAPTSQVWIKDMGVAQFAGADGDVSFDAVGLRVPNIFFGKLQDGKVVE